ILERFPASGIHPASFAPLCFGIIKSRPGGADGEFVGVFAGHYTIEAVEVIASPVASVVRPSFMSRRDPGIEPIEAFVDLALRFREEINQQRGPFPAANGLPHFLPVGITALGKDKYHWAIIKGQIRVIGNAGMRSNVAIIGILEIGDRL